jgi:hypothetical protein
MKSVIELLVAGAAMMLIGMLMGLIVRSGVDENTIPPVSPHRWQGTDADDLCRRWPDDC